MTRPRLILLLRCVTLVAIGGLLFGAGWFYAVGLIPLALFMPVFSGGGATKVLFWNTDWDNAISGATYTNMLAVYAAMGLTVHNSSTWSGTLSDYKLIIWPAAKQDPSWWGSISGGTWAGRIHICTENDTFYGTSNTYVNGLSGVTGMGITGASIDIACYWDGTAETNDLTSGQSTIRYTWTSEVTGGTALSKTVTGSKTWLARNTSGTIDFVVAGDGDHLSDTCAGNVGNNTSFLQNLWNVAV